MQQQIQETIAVSQSTNQSAETPNGSSAPPSAASSSSSPAAASVAQPKVYLPPSSANASSSSSASGRPATILPALPSADEDLKPTADEIKAAYASTVEKNYRMGVSQNAPLMTQSMREKRGIEGPGTRRTYDQIRVRFRFSDRTQLEYTLPSSQTLASLYPLLRSALQSEASTKPFVLYTSPPKIDFAESDCIAASRNIKSKFKGKKIGEMGWAGSVVINVRWTSIEDEKLNNPSTPAPITDELRQRGETLEPPKMGMRDGEGNGTSSVVSGSRTLGVSAGSDESKEKKIPKWLKAIKK